MDTSALDSDRRSTSTTVARIGVVATSMLLVGVLIVNTSRAVFTTATDNPGNAFNAATISLTDNDGSTALFSVPAMVPGDFVTGCIDVIYAGSADPGPVKIYQNAYTETDGASDGATLDSALTFVIDRVDDCTARNVQANVAPGTTLVSLAVHSNYTNGLLAQWDPASGGATESYLFRATFTPSGSSATDNTRIGDTVSALTFTWETQAGS